MVEGARVFPVAVAVDLVGEGVDVATENGSGS